MSQFIQFDSAKQPKCKVELHIHLEGAVRLTTVWEISQKKGIILKAKSLDDFISSCSKTSPSTLTDFLKPFAIFLPPIVGDADAIERIAFEFCEDIARQGVLYCEVRFCPHLLSTQYGHPVVQGGQPVSPRDVVRLVCRGLNRGAEQFQVTVRSILCCLRPNPEWSSEILELCLEFKNSGVVAIDVAGDESVEMASPEIVQVFKRAAASGLHRTAHAGEAGPASNVRMALTEMHAERIGHGYHVVDDPDLYEECLERRVHFETCPYSSCLTGAVPLSEAKHPIVRFAEDDANFSVSRDDPTITQKTLDQEYELLRQWGLKDVHLARANFNAARSCFLPEDQKIKLIQKLMEVYGASSNHPILDSTFDIIPVNAVCGREDC